MVQRSCKNFQKPDGDQSINLLFLWLLKYLSGEGNERPEI
jgi:hypothetical protein